VLSDPLSEEKGSPDEGGEEQIASEDDQKVMMSRRRINRPIDRFMRTFSGL